jgi:hypothetical protein
VDPERRRYGISDSCYVTGDKLIEIRTKVKNSLQHLAMNRGMQRKSRLWSPLGRSSSNR